jgi:hypothetical protein
VDEDGVNGTIRVLTNRAGTASELSQFLQDFEAAYLALYGFDAAFSDAQRRRWLEVFEYFPQELAVAVSGLYPPLAWRRLADITPDTVLPKYRLVVTSVRIESPGLWEFLGSLNPLQQIRQYLNDRHERRKDREYREEAEKKKLELENDILQAAVWEKEDAVLHGRINMLKELGYTEEEIRQLAWGNLGPPLKELGGHQDSGFIDRVE